MNDPEPEPNPDGQTQERYTGNRSQRRSRKRQVSFGLPFEGPRRLRQHSFGLGAFFDKPKAGEEAVTTEGDAVAVEGSVDGVGSQCHDDHKMMDVDVDQQEVVHHDNDINNKWGRGIVTDFKKTIGTHWWKEMTNLNQTVVATTFFLFFACIAPAITFGAIYAKATGNWIGAIEMITATAWCGIFYALVGGQPMMINGGTGPVLAFSAVLYSMSKSIGVPFLTFNAWVGLWVTVYLIIAAVVDLNKIIQYATRFTDEIFALLISVIFIINALGNPFAPVGIYYYFEESHASHDVHDGATTYDYSYMATALLSLILCLGTVALTFWLKEIKFSPFGPNQITRNIIHDFAVVASIVIMSLVGNVLFKEVKTETLNVPDTFAPTYACCTVECTSNWPSDCEQLTAPYRQRPWIVDLFELNGHTWVPYMAAGPALLAFILVFLDDGITWHLINHPSHKLKHGDAYNYDTIIIAFMIAVNSMLGLPWLVAATVRSLNHIHAMATKTSGGKFMKVRETRLSGLGIHLLCLVTIFALSVLKLIPMPILYGIFLYMGLVSLSTNQFWSRILFFFKQPSRYSDMGESFTHLRPMRIHFFTIIQLFLFIALYFVKAFKAIAIAFPIIIALCIPIRLYILPKLFTKDELVLLDGDDNAIRDCLEKESFDFDHQNNHKTNNVDLEQINADEDDSDDGLKKKVVATVNGNDQQQHSTTTTPALTPTDSIVVEDNNNNNNNNSNGEQQQQRNPFFSDPSLEPVSRSLSSSVYLEEPIITEDEEANITH